MSHVSKGSCGSATEIGGGTEDSLELVDCFK